MAIQLKLILITLSLGLISSTAIASEASEKYSTRDVREMWQMCSIKFHRTGVAPSAYIPLCDCYVDLMRHTFTKREFTALDPSKTKAIGEMLKTACPIPQAQSLKLINGDTWRKNSQNRSI